MIRTVTAVLVLTFALAVGLPRMAPEAGAQQQFAQAEKKKKKQTYRPKYKNPMKQ
jgi:hypothetical protein